MKRLALTVAIVLFAADAHAIKSICLIGDSIMWGVGDRAGRSRLNAGEVLQQGVDHLPSGTWKDALVWDLGVTSSWPGDWVGPVTSGRCLFAPVDNYPHLTSACRDGVGLADRMPACDLCFVLGDGSEVQSSIYTVTQQVDATQSLLTKLGSLCPDGVILLPPPLTETLDGTDTQTQYDAVRTEMVARSMTLTPSTWSPRLQLARDGVHLTDHSYVRVGDAMLRALP